VVSRPSLCTGRNTIVVEHQTECSGCKVFSLEVKVGNYSRGTCCASEVVHLPAIINTHKHTFIHSPCVHNHIDALIGRVGKCVPKPTDAVLQLKPYARSLAYAIGHVVRMTRRGVVEGYRGAKRRRYQRALDNLERGKAWRGTVNMFVKDEVNIASRDKPNPSCRAIQYRDFEYALELATYIKPLEHKLYELAGCRFFPKTRFIMKGLSGSERGVLLREKFDNLGGCFIYVLDVSRWDAHISQELLLLEHHVYNRVYSDKLLRKLLKKQLVNKGRTRRFSKDGVLEFDLSYKVGGGRMSGDMNTGCGNVILMCMVIANFLRQFNLIGDFGDDGDDCVVMIKGPRLADEVFINYFLGFGLSVKVECVTECFEELDFCQCRPVFTGREYTMVRSPIRSMTKALVNPKYVDVRYRPKLVKTIALGELSLVHGIPILDSFFRCMVRGAERSMSKRGRSDGGIIKNYKFEYRLLGADPFRKLPRIPILAKTRQSFHAAWGIDPKRQQEIEQFLDKFDLDIMTSAGWADGIDVARWLMPAHMPEQPYPTFF